MGKATGTSHEQVEANCKNSRKSTGPRNSEPTWYNATRQGLLAEDVSELDNPDAYALANDLITGILDELGDKGHSLLFAAHSLVPWLAEQGIITRYSPSL